MKNQIIKTLILGSALFGSTSYAMELLPENIRTINSFSDFEVLINGLKTYPEHYHDLVHDEQGKLIEDKDKFKEKTKDLDSALDQQFGIFQKKDMHRALILQQQESEKPIVSLQELLKAVDETAEVVGERVSSSQWIDAALEKGFFTQPVPKIRFSPIHYKYYVPFEKTLILGDDETPVFFGDLHGGAKSLVESIKKYINPDSFKLKDEKTHLVFLGDLVDCGTRGTEVLYLLNRLLKENENVHVIRGNHEDIQLNNEQGFRDELKIKYPGIVTEEVANKIARFYDFLPSALWVGQRRFSPTARRILPLLMHFVDWRLACHGGIELGDANVAQLLAATNKIAFKHIGQLAEDSAFAHTVIIDRKSNFEKLPKKLQKTIQDSFNKQDSENKNKELKDLLRLQLRKFIPISPQSGYVEYKTKDGQEIIERNECYKDTMSNGYNWNLFNEDGGPAIPLSIVPAMANAWKYNQLFTASVFSLFGTWRHRIVGIFRGHQHVNNTKEYNQWPLMEQIINNNGVFTMGQKTNEQNAAIKRNAITTLGVAPDTEYGIPDRPHPNSPKRYPGVYSYTAFKLKPVHGYLFSTLKAEKVKIDILPQYLIDEQMEIMNDNKQVDLLSMISKM